MYAIRSYYAIRDFGKSGFEMDAPRRSPRAARRKGHVVGGGLVRIGPLMAMPTVVRELGGDPDSYNFV